jgi:hypothetical protein
MGDVVFKHPAVLILQLVHIQCNVYFMSYKLEEASNYNWKFAMETHLKTCGVVLNEIITNTKTDMTGRAKIHLKVKPTADAQCPSKPKKYAKI